MVESSIDSIYSTNFKFYHLCVSCSNRRLLFLLIGLPICWKWVSLQETYSTKLDYATWHSTFVNIHSVCQMQSKTNAKSQIPKSYIGILFKINYAQNIIFIWLCVKVVSDGGSKCVHLSQVFLRAKCITSWCSWTLGQPYHNYLRNLTVYKYIGWTNYKCVNVYRWNQNV